MHNVEKSKFRKGEYVGYSCGKVWKIRKGQFGGWKWYATHATLEGPMLYADRLQDISAQLSKLNANAIINR